MIEGRQQDAARDDRVMVIMDVTYYRSDLAAEMLQMHKNTLLEKARNGEIRKYRHKHAIWFTEPWMRAYMDRKSR